MNYPKIPACRSLALKLQRQRAGRYCRLTRHLNVNLTLGNCLNCIEVLSAQLDILSKYEAKNNFLLATNGLNPRELSVFKSVHKINFEVCSIENGFSILSKDEEEKFLPLYYIVVDSSNKIIDSFIPLNDLNDEYTSKFLNRHL